MWNILSLQLKASIASWKLERIFRCGFRFQCCIKLCTISQLNCWKYQGWQILLNFTKNRRQFAWCGWKNQVEGVIILILSGRRWKVCHSLSPGLYIVDIVFAFLWPHLFFKVVVLHLRLVSTRVEVLRKKIKLKMSVLRMARWISCQMPWQGAGELGGCLFIEKCQF